MGFTSIWHWLILGVIVLLLFGKGRISDVMGDVAKGIRSFRKGLSEEETPPQPSAPPPPSQVQDGRLVDITPPPTENKTPSSSDHK